MAIRAAAAGTLLAGLLLAIWGTAYPIFASEDYRNHLTAAMELLLLGAMWYPALVAAVTSAAALAWAAALRRFSWGDAFLVGAPVGAAAGLFAHGLLAAPGRHLLATGAGRLDLLAGLVAAAGAWAGAGLAWRAGAMARIFEPRVAHLLTQAAGLHVAAIAWMTAIERIDAPTLSATGLLLAAASLAGGAVLAWLAASVVLAAAGRRRRGLWRAGSAGLLLAAASAALLAGRGAQASWAGGEAGAAPAGEGRPNILMIVADTLRADHVGSYGASRPTTPNLDALAARGVRFRTSYASASWTGPATASILTGLHPTSHGLTTYRERIRADAESLASVLSSAGYATAGFSANPVLSRKLGFGDGFDVWIEQVVPSALERHKASALRGTLTALGLHRPPLTFPRAEALASHALDWLGERRRDAPFFLYLQLMDPHDPYAPAPPWDRLFLPQGVEPFPMGFGTLPRIEQGTIHVEERDLARLLAAYDGAIAYMDDQIGRLLEEMGRRGLLDGTLIVFTSDHGEEFNDHGLLGHEHTLYEELVRVPLIFAGEGVREGIVPDSIARSIDIAPTILDAAGLAFPVAPEGKSLWPAVSAGEQAPGGGPIFLEESYIGVRSPVHHLRAVRQGALKLIGSTFHAGGRGPYRWELYDLEADPSERRDLAADRPEEVSSLRESIEAWSRRPRAGRREGPPLDADLEERLRALGYIQ